MDLGSHIFLVCVQCSDDCIFFQSSAENVVTKFLPKAAASITCTIYWNTRDEHGVGADINIRHSSRWFVSLRSTVPVDILGHIAFVMSPDLTVRRSHETHEKRMFKPSMSQVGESVLTPVVSSRSPRLTNRLLNNGAT